MVSCFKNIGVIKTFVIKNILLKNCLSREFMDIYTWVVIKFKNITYIN